ncbi:flagellar hook-length control protein FliK [Bacillus sp. CGMCC 1.16607]|uniref:flagellar hook-length control protein FliK n=1 Tax=Bacillus sp. CGMCC 1.16607 TaxID=3351842 RepID=UPI00362F29EF
MGSIGVRSIQFNNDIKMENTSKSNQLSPKGFGAVLSTILQTDHSTPKEDLQGNIPMSSNEMEELISFLQNQDLFNLDNGAEILNKLLDNSNSKIEELPLETLSMSADELLKLLNELANLLGNDGKDQIPIHFDEKELIENMDDILALLTKAQSLPNQEFQKIVDQDFAKILKFTKLVDLLSKNQDNLRENEKLSKLLEAITNKIEQLMKSNTTNFRTEYLQKTFTLLSKEIKQSNSGFGRTVVDSLLNQNSQIIGKEFELPNNGVSLLQQMSKPEQLTLMLEGSKKPVSPEQLMKQFESILSKSQFTKMDGMQKLMIKLAPEHLGSLRIELIHKDQMLVAKILTTTGAAKDTLDSHLNGLKQAMANQNIHVEKIEISQQLTPQERPFQRDTEHQEQGHEQESKKKDKHESNGEFTESFAEALVNLEV